MCDKKEGTDRAESKIDGEYKKGIYHNAHTGIPGTQISVHRDERARLSEYQYQSTLNFCLASTRP